MKSLTALIGGLLLTGSVSAQLYMYRPDTDDRASKKGILPVQQHLEDSKFMFDGHSLNKLECSKYMEKATEGTLYVAYLIPDSRYCLLLKGDNKEALLLTAEEEAHMHSVHFKNQLSEIDKNSNYVIEPHEQF
jgi:hypothetical protein